MDAFCLRTSIVVRRYVTINRGRQISGDATRNLASRRRAPFHELPSSLRPELQLRMVDDAIYAVDGDKHRSVAILSIGHREAGFGTGYHNVSFVDDFYA